MSANDDVSLFEIPDRAETEPPESGVNQPDITPVRRGYQNLFRTVCLRRQKAPDDSV
jgi:hypothetical protein